MALEAVRDVPLGVHQKIARQTDNPLIRATAGRWRQLGDGGSGDVDADHGKVATVKLPNVRATPAGGGLCPILMRVGTDAFQKCNHVLFGFPSNSFCYESVANKPHRSLTVKFVFANMARKHKIANVVGKEIQKQRYQMGLTQEQFATQCQLQGLDISRGTVSQIEAQIRCVSDSELFLLASVLGVSTESLYPASFRKVKRRKSK